MNFSDDSLLDGAIKITLGGMALVFINRIANIFKGDDKKFSVKEFGRFIGFVVLTYWVCHILWKNGARITEWVPYDDMTLFLLLSAWLAVLHLDDALKSMVRMMELLIQLKSKTTITESVKDSNTHSITTEKKVEEP